MKGAKSLHFISPTWGKMTLTEVKNNIEQYLQADDQARYKVVIGTDSRTTKESTLFVTALIIHRVGKGARFFFRKVKNKPLLDLRYRIYRETELSLELTELLKKQGIADLLVQWPIEIHIDIGQVGETKKLIQEVVGWATAFVM